VETRHVVRAYTRRRLVRGTGLVLAGGIAGCASPEETDDEEGDEADDETDDEADEALGGDAWGPLGDEEGGEVGD
jgi:hypothetical protein